MVKRITIGGIEVTVDTSTGDYIFPDDDRFSKYGWVSDNFEGYLILAYGRLWISSIFSLHEHQGNFIKLLTRLIASGYEIFIPTPSDRMKYICNKFCGFILEDFHGVWGLYHNKAGKIYTSYYAKNLSSFERNLLLIQISNSCPKGYERLHKLSKVIPDWNNIVQPHKAGIINDEVYNFKYWTQIKDKLPDVAAELTLIAVRSGMDVVLMCWESPDKFCHRHLLAEWLSPYLWYRIKELLSYLGLGFSTR